jgi:hypothetical protein
MVSHTCFSHVENASAHNNVQLCVEGQLEAVLLEAKMVRQQQPTPFAKHPTFINGVEDWRAEIRTGHSDMLKILDDGQASELYSDRLNFGDFVTILTEGSMQDNTVARPQTLLC